MYVTYALEDPRDNTVFYVGMTNDWSQRYIKHLRCEENNKEKNARILDLRAHGLLPLPRTLATHATRQEARESEGSWIAHYTLCGVPLTNTYAGATNSPAQEQETVHLKSKSTPLSKYQLREVEVQRFIAAYRACGNKDKALHAIGKGSNYREAAERIIQVYALRREEA